MQEECQTHGGATERPIDGHNGRDTRADSAAAGGASVAGGELAAAGAGSAPSSIPSELRISAALYQAVVRLVDAPTGAEVCAIVADQLIRTVGRNAVVVVSECPHGAAPGRLSAVRVSEGAREGLFDLLDRDPLLVRGAAAALFEHATRARGAIRFTANRRGRDQVLASLGEEIETLLEIGDVHAIALRHRAQLLGHVVILLGGRRRELDTELVEPFLDQAACALARCREAEARHRYERARRCEQSLFSLRSLARTVGLRLERDVSILGCNTHALAEDCAGCATAAPQRDAIRSSALRVAEVTTSLLTFAGAEPRRRVRLDLNRLLEERLASLRVMLGPKTELVTALAAGLWPVVVDPVELERALRCLVENARDAMADGGVVTIATENVERGDDSPLVRCDLPAGSYVRISVRDTGCGMVAATRERAFRPYFTTKTPGENIGLGLATVYGLVHQAGGDVVIDSQVGVGTRVELYLPAAPSRSARSPAADG